MFKRLRARWNKFWEEEDRKLNQCIGEMYIKKTREENKEFFDKFDNNNFP